MNHRKRKQLENQRRKVYTPEGYISDPPDAVCPHCREKQKVELKHFLTQQKVRWKLKNTQRKQAAKWLLNL